MVPNRHGRHTAVRRPRTAGRTVPLVAFLAVLLLGLGGWALIGRDRTDTPAETVALDGVPPAPATERASRDVSRDAEPAPKVPAAQPLGGLFPAPTTTSPATTGPAPTTSAAPPTGTTTAPPPPPPATTTSAPPPPPSGATAIEAEAVRLTNVERAKAGCPAVRTEPRLTTASRRHSVDMVDRDYFSHTSPDGKGPGDRAAAAGYTAWSGENIAAGYPTAAAVVAGWMNSPGHKANILNCDSVAVGVGFDPRENMWTQMFGRS